MIIAYFAAKGTTEIENIHYIERGYECIDQKLKQLGADIKRVHISEISASQLSG